MRVMVTGGAGYIGSVVVRRLVESGHVVVIVDNLSRGFKESVPPDVQFIEADVQDLESAIPASEAFDAVVHLAAYAYVGESVMQPELYWNNNVIGSIKLLNFMRSRNIKKIVFASTCATYGASESVITETSPAVPVSAYGMSKLAVDMALASESIAYSLAATCLRFFNVAGAYRDAGERHDPETHIIPLALKAATENGVLTIFGTDYPTPDGTCVRDYIHVLDLAIAIEKSLLLTKNGEHKIYNIGTGVGLSNKQIVETVKKVTGHAFTVDYTSRRPGDAPCVVASSNYTKEDLGWEPQHSTIENMISDAWRFRQMLAAGSTGAVSVNRTRIKQ